jgi:hypothetical protein
MRAPFCGDPDPIRRQLEGYLTDWKGLLRANVQQRDQQALDQVAVVKYW